MSTERYQRGAHAVKDFKYHFVWKTKYSYGVPTEEQIKNVWKISQTSPAPSKLGMNQRKQKINSSLLQSDSSEKFR